MSETAILFENLHKVYREGFWGKKAHVVRGLHLSIPKNTIFGFLGANGAGKTTCIKIMMGLQYATEGRALAFGIDCKAVEARAKIGYLPERPYFHDTLSAEEFLHFHRSLQRHTLGKRSRTNQELLELVGIPGTEKKILRTFSKGMLQRIGIAQALLGDPELVVLDEPMSGLDPVGRRDIRNLILQLAREGKTVFFSTHILADAESLCQQIAFLEKGELNFQGKLEEILSGDTQEFEIIFTKIPPEMVKNQFSTAVPLGAGYRLNVHGEANAQKMIELLWQKGASVTNYTRAQKTLEEALFGLKREGKS